MQFQFLYMTPKSENNYGHVLKYISIFGGVQGLNIIVGLVRNKIVAALLGPGGMGLVSLFNSTVSFISQATNLGISFSAVRHISEYFDAGDQQRIAHFIKVVRLWSLLTALIGLLLCMIAGPFLNTYTFSWGNHTMHFVLLAPAVALAAITGGETAILKGCRRLKELAMIQVVNVFAALLLSLPVYYFFGEAGIVPVIVLMALVLMLSTIAYSYRFYPLQLHGYSGLLSEGGGMIRLGIAFVLAGVMNAGSEMFIRSYLNVVGGLNVVGLYNAGFMLTMTYVGLVFSAMETDYFPRLSGLVHDNAQLCDTVNRQIEVTLLLVAPMLTFMIIGLPIIIPMLFTSDFLPVVAMCQVVLLSMFLRSVYLPIAYITLAKADSLQYLFLEGLYDILLVILVIVGYRHWGLTGTGVALALANVLDVVMIYFYARSRYHFIVSTKVLRYLAIHLLLGIAAYLLTFVNDAHVYCSMGAAAVTTSLLVSLLILRSKVRLWNALCVRFGNLFKRQHNDYD